MQIQKLKCDKMGGGIIFSNTKFLKFLSLQFQISLSVYLASIQLFCRPFPNAEQYIALDLQLVTCNILKSEFCFFKKTFY